MNRRDAIRRIATSAACAAVPLRLDPQYWFVAEAAYRHGLRLGKALDGVAGAYRKGRDAQGRWVRLCGYIAPLGRSEGDCMDALIAAAADCELRAVMVRGKRTALACWDMLAEPWVHDVEGAC